MSNIDNTNEVTETEAGTIDVSASNGVRGMALGLAAVLENDKDEIGDDNETIPSLVHLLERLTISKEEVQRAPLEVLVSLQDKYGERLSEFPEPDTEQGQTGNRPYDKGKITVVVDGEAKQRNSNFYSEFFAATSLGKRIDAKLEALSAALDPKKDQSPLNSFEANNNADKEWISLVRANKDTDRVWLVTEKKMYEQRRSSGRSYIKRAMKLHFAMERIETTFEGVVGIEVVTYHDANGDEKTARTINPFYLYDTAKPAGSAVPVNVSQMIKLGSRDTIAEAKQKGGKFSDLMGTLRRESGTNSGQGDKDKAIKSVATTEQFIAASLAISNFIDYESDDGNEHIVAVKNLMKGKHGDQVVWEIGRLYHSVKNIYDTVRGRYERLLEANVSQTENKSEAA